MLDEIGSGIVLPTEFDMARKIHKVNDQENIGLKAIFHLLYCNPSLENRPHHQSFINSPEVFRENCIGEVTNIMWQSVKGGNIRSDPIHLGRGLTMEYNQPNHNIIFKDRDGRRTIMALDSTENLSDAIKNITNIEKSLKHLSFEERTSDIFKTANPLQTLHAAMDLFNRQESELDNQLEHKKHSRRTSKMRTDPKKGFQRVTKEPTMAF